MKIRSRGLGRRELEMDLREFTVERDGTGVLLKGVTHAPITWETTVWVGPRDVGTILRMAAHLAMLRLGLAWVLRRQDVPAVDHAGERLGRAPTGGAVPNGGQATAAAASTSPTPDTAQELEPDAVPDASQPDGATRDPAPSPTSAPSAAPAPPARQPPPPRPERLVRAERPSRPPTPPRPPRPPRPERPARPDQRERHVVRAAGGPPARPAAGADGNGKEH